MEIREKTMVIRVRMYNQDKTGNLFWNITAEGLESDVARFFIPMFKPALQQISLLQNGLILTTNWTKFRGSNTIQGT